MTRNKYQTTMVSDYLKAENSWHKRFTFIASVVLIVALFALGAYVETKLIHEPTMMEASR